MRPSSPKVTSNTPEGGPFIPNLLSVFYYIIPYFQQLRGSELGKHHFQDTFGCSTKHGFDRVSCLRIKAQSDFETITFLVEYYSSAVAAPAIHAVYKDIICNGGGRGGS